MVFEIDVNEPNEILPLIFPVIQDAIQQPLNVMGYADYKWTRSDRTVVHVERKTWPELLADCDRVEEQLQRHLNKNPNARLVFMLEGIIKQNEMGTVVLRETNNGLFVKGHRYSTRLSRIFPWLYEISNYCQVIQTTSLQESASCLVAMYKHDQKPNHDTLRRHIKQVNFNTDPRVTMLMGTHAGLGDKRATALINKFGTPFNIWTAGYRKEPIVPSVGELTSVDGIGPTIVRNMLQSIGRDDV